MQVHFNKITSLVFHLFSSSFRRKFHGCSKSHYRCASVKNCVWAVSYGSHVEYALLYIACFHVHCLLMLLHCFKKVMCVLRRRQNCCLGIQCSNVPSRLRLFEAVRRCRKCLFTVCCCSVWLQLKKRYQIAGQLGQGTAMWSPPTVVQGFEGEIQDIACGAVHTIVLTSNTSSLSVWRSPSLLRLQRVFLFIEFVPYFH